MARKYVEEENFRQYVIPYNFIDESKMFGGLIKTRNFVEGAILSIFFIAPILLLPIHSLLIKSCLLIFFGMPPIVLGVIGLNNDALSTFFLYFMKYRKKKRKVYFNSKVKRHSVVDIEEGLQAELPRDKVMKLFGPIINKRGTDNSDESEGAFVFDDDIDSDIKKRKEKNRKIDYSTDAIVYEGFVIDNGADYPVELDIMASEIMQKEEYDAEIPDEAPPAEEDMVLEYEDVEIIEELEKISREVDEFEDVIEADEFLYEENMLKKEQDEYFEMIGADIEIFEIEHVEGEINSEQNIVNENPDETVGNEPKIEAYSDKNNSGGQIDEQQAEITQKTDLELLYEPHAIDILSFGIKKLSEKEKTFTKEPAKGEEEIFEQGIEHEDITFPIELEAIQAEPFVFSTPQDGNELFEDTETSDETDKEDIAPDMPRKRKRRRKRRKNKKHNNEGGE